MRHGASETRANGPSATIYKAPRQDKPWGHEVIFAAVEGHYVGKIIHVDKGQSLSLQFHENKDETISVISGNAIIEYGRTGDSLVSGKFAAGDTIHLPSGVVHRVTAETDLVFVEASTADPGWREDVIRLEDRYGRQGTSQP